MAGANFGREKNTKVSLAGALHKWPEYGQSIKKSGRSIPEVARLSGKGYFWKDNESKEKDKRNDSVKFSRKLFWIQNGLNLNKL